MTEETPCAAQRCAHCRQREDTEAQEKSLVPVDASVKIAPAEVERRIRAMTGEGAENRWNVRVIT